MFDLKILLQEGFHRCRSPCCLAPGPRARPSPYGCHPQLLAGRGIKGGNKPCSLFHGFVDFVHLAAPPACTASPATRASLVSLGFACASVEEEEALCMARWHRDTATRVRAGCGGSGTKGSKDTPGPVSPCSSERDGGKLQWPGQGRGLSRPWGTVTAVSPGGAEGMC